VSHDARARRDRRTADEIGGASVPRGGNAGDDGDDDDDDDDDDADNDDAIEEEPTAFRSSLLPNTKPESDMVKPDAVSLDDGPLWERRDSLLHLFVRACFGGVRARELLP
jgi:hypothetical protein